MRKRDKTDNGFNLYMPRLLAWLKNMVMVVVWKRNNHVIVGGK